MSDEPLLVLFVEGLAASTGHAAEATGWSREVRVDAAKRASRDLPRLLWHESRHVAWAEADAGRLPHAALDAASWLGLDRLAFVLLGRPAVPWVDLDACGPAQRSNLLYGKHEELLDEFERTCAAHAATCADPECPLCSVVRP
jgi:hypothetical protein